MNLAQAIHQQWAAAADLDDLLPASRFYTGLAIDGAMPYATLSLATKRPASRCHDGSAIAAPVATIRIVGPSYDAVAAIAEQLKRAFDGADFALSGSDRVIDVRRCGESQTQDGDGVWQFVIEFDCTVYLESGA